MTPNPTHDLNGLRDLFARPEALAATLIRHRKLRDQFRQIGETFIYFADAADYLAEADDDN